jgi:serine/threonine protein kinase
MPSVSCLSCHAENAPAAATCRACGVALVSGLPLGTAALPIGTQLKGGLYSVGRVLGRGGFGITYLGGDLRQRYPVAIKEFFPFGARRRGTEVCPAARTVDEFAAARAKFRDEAARLTWFRHPGIVAVFDCFEEHGTAYMVMELLRGRPLGTLLAERGAFPEREAVEHIRRAGEPLGVVHRAGLLHRDIKPDNLMLQDNGRVALIDFGTARAFASGMASQMTAMVTHGYAPLEQYVPEARFGPYSDVYALAATLFQLVSGHMPPPALSRAGGVELKPPHRLNPDISPRVSEAIMWGLEMRVDRRPQTVRAFTEVLRPPARSSVPRPSRSPSAATPPSEPLSVHPSSPPLVPKDPRGCAASALGIVATLISLLSALALRRIFREISQ